MDSEFGRRVGGCLAKLHLSFSHLACSQPAAMVWAEAMDGIAIEDVEEAVREYIRGQTKTPTPAHIRRLAIDNAKAARDRAKHVKINGVTYFTNAPDLERQKAEREQNRRLLERIEARTPPKPPEQVRETQAEFEARKQASMAKLRAVAAAMEAKHERDN